MKATAVHSTPVVSAPARTCLCLVFLTLLWLCCPQPGAAQTGAAGGRYVQLGMAILPGFGIEAGYVRPRNFYTAEVMLFADGTPAFAGGEGNLQVSLGLGGSLRPFGFLRTIGNADYVFDVDVGLRFGPSLLFVTNATREAKNQQFSLFLEPFARFITRLGGGQGRIVFAEVGTHRPFLRAGMWLSL